MNQHAEIILSPDDDFNVVVGPLKTVLANGAKTPVVDGIVSGFLATSKTASSSADALLEAPLSYVGGNSDGDGGTYEVGMWLFQLDASVLTRSRLSDLFAATRPWLIVSRSGDIRRGYAVTYYDAIVGPVVR